MSSEEVDRRVEKFRWMVDRLARKEFPTLCHDQDFLQSGLIGLWRAAETWDHVNPFYPYAKACIKNAFRDYIRAAGRHAETVDLDDLPPVPVAGGEEAAVERLDLLRMIDAAWPPNSRENYVLRALSNGVSKATLAVALGMDARRVQRLAERAWERIEQLHGDM